MVQRLTEGVNDTVRGDEEEMAVLEIYYKKLRNSYSNSTFHFSIRELRLNQEGHKMLNTQQLGRPLAENSLQE